MSVTWDPNNKAPNTSLSNNNLTAVAGTGANPGISYPGGGVKATVGKSTGKWYCEITNQANNRNSIGICNAAWNVNRAYPHHNGTAGEFAVGMWNWGYYYLATIGTGNATYAGATCAGTCIIGIALDMDLGKVEFYVNNALAYTYSDIKSQTDTVYPHFLAHNYDGLPTVTANFGDTAFTYTPPSGYQAYNIDEIPITSLDLSETSFSMNGIDSTHQMIVIVLPSTATQSATWSSSDTSVVSVSNKGVVTALGFGTAVITASRGGFTKTCTVTVQNYWAVYSNRIKTKLTDMQIGDAISCEYTAASGVAGSFSKLGYATKSEIPIGGTATPDGKFYFIKVAKGLCIADRVIQHSIPWDVLNAARLIEGYWVKQSCTPTMISNTTPSGITSASSEDTTYQAWMAFNKNFSEVGWSNGGGTTGWLAYEFIEAKVVNAYSITPRIDTSKYIPRNWTFEGWDGSNWIILDTRTSQTISVGTTAEYHTSNKVAYLKYRINVTAVNSGSYVNIGEFQLFDGLVETYMIRSLTGGSLYRNLDGQPTTVAPNSTLGAWPTNEWDTYVAKSSLDGLIPPGDVGIWHWNLQSWCRDTQSISFYTNTARVIRGKNSIANCFNAISSFVSNKLDPTVFGFAYCASGNVNANYGFRPVLEYKEAYSKATTLWY